MIPRCVPAPARPRLSPGVKLMWRSMLKTAAATAAYALVHSALASPDTKRAVRGVVGRRAYDGLYRTAYNAEAILGLVALRAYGRRLPDVVLYEVTGPAALALRAGQVAALAAMGWAQWHVGPLRFSGVDGLVPYLRGDAEIPPTPVGQGPSPAPDGASMHDGGPFRYTRHPLNLATPVILWLNPRMTANLVAFNLVATAHFLYGSLREERHLDEAYGDAYRAYQASGVPFYLPAPAPAPIPTPAGR